ncbi:MAG: carbohydrate kinase family protein [Gammaproteobacteria bacterium]|nr:carbohydrate kinase family protein [Gammaproteobacteria bacterium]
MPNTIHNTPYVLIIGGANIDFTAFPYQPLIWHDSNPGVVKTSLGGVGRNIADNLARLSVATKLLSLVGDDTYGHHLIDETSRVGVDMSAVTALADQRTSTYFSIMNTDDDMAVAIADMGIIHLLTPERLQKHIDLINNADLIVLDTNLSTDSLQFLLTHFTNKRFLVDTVSVTKAQKIKPLLAHIDMLKPNRLEAEYLTGIEIKSLDDAKKAIENLLEQGVKQVFMSIGKEGILYGSHTDNGFEFHHSPALPTKVINAAGAGDSMMASIAYGTIKQLPIADVLRFANATASITLMAETTISPELSVESVHRLLENI